MICCITAKLTLEYAFSCKKMVGIFSRFSVRRVGHRRTQSALVRNLCVCLYYFTKLNKLLWFCCFFFHVSFSLYLFSNSDRLPILFESLYSLSSIVVNYSGKKILALVDFLSCAIFLQAGLIW